MNNRIVGLGSPELGILASICDEVCGKHPCFESCQPMRNLIEYIFELQKQAGYEVYEDDSELGEKGGGE